MLCDHKGDGNGLAHGEQTVGWGVFATTAVTTTVYLTGTVGEVGFVCDGSGDGNGLNKGEHPVGRIGVATTPVTGAAYPMGNTRRCEVGW